jgi:hypothetical protein
MDADQMVPETPYVPIVPQLVVNDQYSPLPTGPPTVKFNEFKDAIEQGNLVLLK